MSGNSSRYLSTTFLILGTILYFFLVLSAIAEADFNVNINIFKKKLDPQDGFKKREFNKFF